MSNLRNIVTALAALTVTYTDEATISVTVSNYGVQSAPSSMPSANLPVRLVGLLRGGANSSVSFLDASGNDGKVEHSIGELALLMPVGLSRPVDEWPDTMRYSDAYMLVVQSNRSIYARCEIEQASLQRGMFEYPSGSGEYFYGIETSLRVCEYI